MFLYDFGSAWRILTLFVSGVYNAKANFAFNGGRKTDEFFSDPDRWNVIYFDQA